MKKPNTENAHISAGMDQATHERLAHLLGLCLYRLNLETNDIELTLNTTRITGYEYNDLPRSNESKGGMILESDLNLVNDSIYSIVSGQKDHYHIEYRMRRRDGSIVWIEEVGIISEYSKDGKPLYMSAMAVDLSRIKWAEEKAHAIEMQTQKLLGENTQALLIDENRLLRASNSAAAMIVGGFHQKYETVLHQAMQILAESLNANYACIWRNCVKDNETCCSIRTYWTTKARSLVDESNTLFKYADILPRWQERLAEGKFVALSASALPRTFISACDMGSAENVLLVPLYLHGDFWGMIGFERSERPFAAYEAGAITGGAIIIASSVARNEDLGKINNDREKAIADTLAKGEFLSRMSHELRTPLNAIIGMTNIALKEKELQKVPGHLKKVEASSQLLLSIINDILDMSKIESGKMEFLKEPFNFNKMLRNAENIIRVKIDEKNQRFTLKLADGLANKVISDENRLLQVVVNLLSNAAKFTPENGKITLTATQRKIGENRIRLRVDVTDNGIGISQEQQKKLFRSFEQADGGISRKYGGTGLGLAISKRILNSLGGDIWVKSKPGQGASFFFELETELGERIEEEKEEILEIENATPDWSGHTILLADDIEINREIIELMLSETGVKIVGVQNGQEAVDALCAAPDTFSLVLMDIQMPVLNGLDATRIIREMSNPVVQTIPVIAMTANAFSEDVETCLKAGMNGHIAKPLVAEQFFFILNKYLR